MEDRVNVGIPRVYMRSGWYNADFRKYGGSRTVLRDPSHPRWPEEGDRTSDGEVAMRWALRYLDMLRDRQRAAALGRDKDKRTLAEAVRLYLEEFSLVVADNTYNSSKSALDHFIEEVGGRTFLYALDTPHLRRTLHRLLREGYQLSTVHLYQNRIQQFLEWAGIGRLKVELPKVPEPDVEPFSDAEIELVRAAAVLMDQEGAPFPVRLSVELALATGMRRGEMFGAYWQDIDVEARTIRVVRQLRRGGVESLPKSKKGRTAIVLPSWWEHHDHDATGRILPKIGSTPQHKWLQKLLDKAGVNRLGRGWHTFRHTYSRLCLEQYEVTLEELQRFLGHTTIQTTERTYGHFRPTHAAERAAGRIYRRGLLREIR